MLDPYVRGFVLTEDRLELPEFTEHEINGAYLYCHPNLPLKQVGDVIVAGRAIPLGNEPSQPGSQEWLDNVSGRFALFIPHARGIRIYHDACGLRSIFYSTEKPIVASHIGLMDVTDASEVELNKPATGYLAGYPGGTTPLRGVFLLTPNTYLDFPANKPVRYFPHRDLEPLSVSEAASVVLEGMRIQMEALKEEKIFISLTAGLDSRLTLAATRSSGAEFVTYYWPNKEASVIDFQIAREIARRLDLKHIAITPSNYDRKVLNELRQIAAKGTYYKHLLTVVLAYRQIFNQEHIHIRSNLAEIGRVFYKPRKKPMDPQRMSELFMFGKGGPMARPVFESFFERTDFGNLRNYDPYDMFYWEQRMGCWHSQVVLESDLVCDTHVLFNSRRILNAMLSVPLQERMRASLFHELISRELPELGDVPINPKIAPSFSASNPAFS